MNIPETDLSFIAKVIDSRPAETALPCNLDDVILYQIARDLRLIELSCTVDENIEPPIAGPMALVFHMMLSLSERIKGKSNLQLSEERLRHWLQRYKYYIDREVVFRAIKMTDQFDADDLIAEIGLFILADK